MAIHVKSHRRGKTVVKAHTRTTDQTIAKLDRLVNRATTKALSSKSSVASKRKYRKLVKTLSNRRYEVKSKMQRSAAKNW